MDLLLATAVFGLSLWALCTALLRWSDRASSRPQAPTTPGSPRPQLRPTPDRVLRSRLEQVGGTAGRSRSDDPDVAA
jgi:hypothetical protein